MKVWVRQQKGFTIVELLIVIVVIAILAAITIVAYNGIQTRAENTKTTNAIAAYIKVLNMYATDNGLYPQYNFPCLGGVSPCSNITDTTGPCNGSGQTYTDTSFNTALATEATTLPPVSSQKMDCNGKSYTGAYYAYQNAGKTATIVFYLRGIVPCPSVSGIQPNAYQATGATQCAAVLPAIP